MTTEKLWGCLAVAFCLQACTPAFNWREVQAADGSAMALFPCKPDRFARAVNLAGARVQMFLASCTTAGATFALSHAELADPARSADALAELRNAAARNIGGQAQVLAPVSIMGMTPHPLAERLVIEGRRGDAAVREEAGFFVKGRRVYQATVVGERLDQEAVDTFFAGLRLPS